MRRVSVPSALLRPLRPGAIRRPLVWASVLGAARSGTTFLRIALSAHPKCAIFHEHHLTTLIDRLEALVGRQAYVSDVEPQEADGRDLLRRELARTSGRMSEAVRFYMDFRQTWRPRIRSSPLPLSVDAAARALFEASFERRGLRVVGSKLPLGSGWSEDFTRLAAIPTMRFVLILRNPLDVVNSSLRRARNAAAGIDEWTVGSVQEAVLEWVAANRQMADVLQAYPDRTVLLKYEDLVDDPTRVMATVYHHLGVRPISLRNSTMQVPRSLQRAFLEPSERSYLDKRFPDLDRIWAACSAGELLQDRFSALDVGV